MIVRFGYVAMSMNVANASPSKTMTATMFSKIGDREAALRKLTRIAEENLQNTLRILRHNRAHDIHVFRFSSRLVPLVTHLVTEGWEPFSALAERFQDIGDYVRLHKMRTSLHPDHFTVLTTPRSEVLRTSLADLEHQSRMLTAMGLDERAKCNIHIGGTYGDKSVAIARFRERFPELKPEVRHRLTLENDDKTYTARETLDFAEEIGVPMVLDIHHHQVNPGMGDHLEELWSRIRRTWERNEEDIFSRFPLLQAGGPGELSPPKIHSSSPRDEQNLRAHADYVESAPLYSFLRMIAADTPRLDVMIEAKKKDEALFALMNDLSKLPDVRRMDGATIEIKG
ncbi:MAG: UV DNA damage repair endonuclease UvsE [Gorillibacterium sp.]|nr:UV DNA damage repair endonuclease UvsE [Gorillibacterium sp.]